MYIFGWDGASYQGRPNVKQLRNEGHSFVFEKVTGEGSYTNPFWSQVRDDARASTDDDGPAVLFGSYDWVECQNWSTEADAIADADDYLATLGTMQAGELLAVDFETPQWLTGLLGRDIEAVMKAYLYRLKDTSGQPVIVYTAPYFLEETGARAWGWLGRDFILWQAAPGPVAMLPDDSPWPGTPAPWTTTTLHQHQWHATSSAVQGEFDRNRFRGTLDDLRALGKPSDEQPQQPQQPPPHPGGEGVGVVINAQGETILSINFGGVATSVEGWTIVDAGVSVRNSNNELWDRSVQGNVFGAWVKR